MKKTNTGIAEIFFDENESILYIKLNENVEMELSNTIKHFEIIKEITRNKKYFAMIDASNYYTASPDALKYAASPQAVGNRLAAAHYQSPMANLITTNFYYRTYQPALELRFFKNKEEAMGWLKTLVTLSV